MSFRASVGEVQVGGKRKGERIAQSYINVGSNGVGHGNFSWEDTLFGFFSIANTCSLVSS